MRSPLLTSLLFAVFASASVAVNAAPAAQPAPTSAAAMSPPATHPEPSTMVKPNTAEPSAKVNLNTADADTLQKELTGIGHAKANAIVAYREANGDFASVDELLEVKGIGKAILDKNRDKLGIN
jgi:competence protein ComEA